jgi:hypothetical protein
VLVAQDNDFPTDVDFKWAQDSYNVTQRNIDTWLFFGTFRAQLWLLDQKWSYPGGFTGQQRGRHTARVVKVELVGVVFGGGGGYSSDAPKAAARLQQGQGS